MPVLEGKCIGNVNVEVYQTQDGKTLFYLQGNDPKMIPILRLFGKLFRKILKIG